jgi:DNA repair exonuclease SbcCD nuclease subunit
MVRSTGCGEVTADIRLLCLHAAVEGARVGPVDFTFTKGDDVIRAVDIPHGFAALLCGHIHRAQHLKSDLNGAKLPAPVIYPGSVERTAFAERYENKGYVILEFSAGSRCGSLKSVKFVQLPARPMVDMQLVPERFDVKRMERQLKERLVALNPDSIVRIRILDGGDSWMRKRLTAQCLRRLAPSSMNVSIAWASSG